MKKLDKLVLSSFLGPFTITFLVVVFILLTQHMLKYFDDIIGKGLGFEVIGQLLFYFAIFMTPVALPLAVLLSSLIAFGNLGEHFELTAIKSAGVSLVRIIQPIFFFVIILTGIAFYVNNNLVPKAALEAYSLLYDIKQKKPALDLREGSFYNGIPDISIKVNQKFPDGITLKDIIIYDHRKHDGNKDVTVADSGKMYTILNERYLKLELFDGYNYTEGSGTHQDLVGKKAKQSTETISRSKFAKMQVVFDLSSFQLARTDKKWFQGNRIMRNMGELESDLDSLNKEISNQRLVQHLNYYSFFSFFSRTDSIQLPPDLEKFKIERDSLIKADEVAYSYRVEGLPTDMPVQAVASPELGLNSNLDSTSSVELYNKLGSGDSVGAGSQIRRPRRRKAPLHLEAKTRDSVVVATVPDKGSQKSVLTDSALTAKLDSVMNLPFDRSPYGAAVNKARVVKSQLVGVIGSIDVFNADLNVFRIQWHKILASSFACIAMFLIGAPLGAIIKKGGLGVPFLVSILFFIIYYLLTMAGEKWAKQGVVDVEIGVWAADGILLVVGLVFLRQARLDARLFEADFYQVVFDKVRNWLIVRKIITP